MTHDTLLTTAEVALRWHCTPEFVQRQCASGALSAMRLGKRGWRIALAAVEAYERRQSTGHDPEPQSGYALHFGHPAPASGRTLRALSDDYEPVFPELWASGGNR